jgi:hypothetical protein
MRTLTKQVVKKRSALSASRWPESGCRNFELKAFAKAIIKREGVPSNLSWAPDGQSFTLGNNKKIQLFDFCTIYPRVYSPG